MNLETRLKPYGTWVLAKFVKIENVSQGGIIIPELEGVDDRPNMATVIAVGPGAWSDTHQRYNGIEVETGDIIYYGIHSGIDVNSELILIKEEQIMGTIKLELKPSDL